MKETKEKTMKLQHGCLYTNSHGTRYRVSFNPDLGTFWCVSSETTWDESGQSIGNTNNLIAEVEEYRWVSLAFGSIDEVSDNTLVRRIRGRHWQHRVSRQDLLPHKYVIPQSKPIPVYPSFGSVQTSAGRFSWTVSKNTKGRYVLDIETYENRKRIPL